MGLKTNFSLWKTFNDKFLRLEEKFEIWPAIDTKLGLWNVGLWLYLQSFPNSKRNWKLGFLNVALAGLLIFSQFMKKTENWGFEYQLRLYFQIFPNSVNSWEIGIFKFSLLSYFVRSWGLSFRQGKCDGEEGVNVHICLIILS